MPTRFSDCDNWVALWLADKRSMLDTMVDNLAADLKAGYNPTGLTILRQLMAIAEYRQRFDDECKAIPVEHPEAANRYCFNDLKARGVIA